ncbi:hypothetical protein B0O99DRAFT_643924 [Bisporella sp. PMI_857]|nr:hypothetical protein B0O99DRAFT_643924 [Bisporella sp. PMI_857]
MKPENYIVIRGDVWMVLHFPFHLALILLVEGAAQFILWRKVVEIFGVINGDFTKARKSPTVGTNLEVSELYSNLTNKIFNTYPPKFVRTIKEAQTVFHNIRNSSFGSPSQTKEVDTLFRIIQDSIFCNFDIEAPIIDRSLLKDPDEEWKGNINTFMLVFIYFFIASGITLMMLSLLKATIQPNLDKRNLIRIAIHCMCGIVLAALASSIKTGVGLIYAQSTWVLPTVALSFAFAMALTHIPMPY